MKKFIVLLLLAFVAVGFAEKIQINHTTTGNFDQLRKLLNNRFGLVEGDIENLQAGDELGTGNVFYVDSGIGSDSYTGTEKEQALATIDAAVGKCTANNGDKIYVMQGHAENIASAAALDLDVAGITIIGLGSGDDMPELSLTAQASTIEIAAADVTIQNIRFLGNYTNGVTECIDVTATGDGARIIGCEFKETSSTKELLKMVTLTADADRCVIYGNRFLGEAGGTDSVAINLEGGSDKTLIAYNTFIGDWSGYVIDGTTAASTELAIYGNYIHNADTGAGKTMGFHASTTGGVFGNNCYGNGSSVAIAADAMFVSPDNVVIQVENVETAVTYYDILQTILADTGAYDTDAEYATAVYNALTSAYGGAGTYGQAIEDILADTAAMDTASELQALAGTSTTEKSISKTVSTIANGANNLFAVTGAPIKILEIVAYVTTTEIGAESCLINYNIDPTTPETDTAFGTDGTALEINGDAVGTLYTWDGVLASDLTATTNGVALAMGTDVSYGLICPIGMIELTAAHDGEITGEITVYMRYMPLSSASVVTAQ